MGELMLVWDIDTHSYSISMEIGAGTSGESRVVVILFVREKPLIFCNSFLTWLTPARLRRLPFISFGPPTIEPASDFTGKSVVVQFSMCILRCTALLPA